ncbi:MAG: hypothetical protein WD342_12875 [Verrucomicrobiales bacterium]
MQYKIKTNPTETCETIKLGIEKLLDGLESKHHCKSGVSLPRGRMRRHQLL